MMGSHLRSPVECQLFLADQEATDLYPFLKQVRVEMSRGDATTCAMEFRGVRDRGGRWPVQDHERLRPWTKSRIDARFGSRSVEVMRGFISEVRSSIPQEMADASVTVTAQDESFKLDRQHVRKVWREDGAALADDTIAARIAKRHDLQTDLDPGLQDETRSQNESDIRFLRDRAAANGFEVFIRAGVLYFRRPRLDAPPQPTIMIHAGPATNCLRFETFQDGHKPDSVRVERAPTEGQGPRVVEVTPDLPLLGRRAQTGQGSGLDDFAWVVPRIRGSSEAEADRRAQAKVNEQSLKIVAEGQIDGALYQHVLLTSLPVEVDGAGEGDDGTYYVDRVTHTFSQTGYRQEFRLLRNARGRKGAAAPADPLAAVRT